MRARSLLPEISSHNLTVSSHLHRYNSERRPISSQWPQLLHHRDQASIIESPKLSYTVAKRKGKGIAHAPTTQAGSGLHQGHLVQLRKMHGDGAEEHDDHQKRTISDNPFAQRMLPQLAGRYFRYGRLSGGRALLLSFPERGVSSVSSQQGRMRTTLRYHPTVKYEYLICMSYRRQPMRNYQRCTAA